MSRPKPFTTQAEESGESATSSSGDLLRLTPDQLERWAELIARGEADLPAGLAPAQEEELRQQVRRLRHTRLVQFIARQIACDIHRSAGP